MVDIKFYEVFDEEKKFIRKFLPPAIKVSFESKTIQESSDKFPKAKIICIRTQSIIPQEWLCHIEAVLTRSQGYDHLINLNQLTKGKIKCGYLGSYCADDVAEHAVLTMQMLLRKLKVQLKHFDAFDREGMMGNRYQGKKVLVVGVGNIGKKIVRAVTKLGMPVKGVDVIQKIPSFEYVALKPGIKWADIIFCALPLTDQTKGLLNYVLMKSAGKEKYLINVSRGEITPTADLKKLLDDNVLAGLSLDVFENESEIAEYLRNKKRKITKNIQNILGLKDRDNVIFTPHNAFNSEEALTEKCRLTVQEVVRFLKTKQFRWKV